MAVNGIEELNGEIFSDNLVGLGDEGGSLESSQLGRNEDQDCNICDNKLCNPRVLSCLHVFCETCIEKLFINEAGDSLKFDRTLVCPSCKQETKVGSPGVTSLPPDYILTNILDVSSSDHSVVCTCCKSKERAVARCADCSHFLCPNCNSAHQFMRCFENHRVILFESEDAAVVHKPVFCRTHSSESLLYYCHTCEESVCQECTARAHKAGPAHQCERVAEAEPALRRQLNSLARRAAARADDCQRAVERFDETLADLQRQREEAQSLIRDSYRSYSAVLEAARDRAEKQLERLHSERELKVMDLFDTADRTIQKIERACKFTDRLLRQGDATEIALLKRSAGAQILNLVANVPDFDVTYSIEFQTDFAKFESAVDECFGRFKTESSAAEAAAESVIALRTPSLASSPPALPAAVQSSFEDFSGAPASPLATALPHLTTIGEYNLQQLASLAGKETPPPHVSPVPSPFILADLLAGDLTTTHAYNNLHALAKLGLSADISEMNGVSGPNSNRDGMMALPATPSPRPSGGSLSQDEGAGPFPRAAGKAAPMHIRFKFGQLGGGKGQFNSPHGFCLGNEEDIVVADTNNHRITVFEKTGTYKFHFGTAGKDEGQLWYPRKVAVMRATGKFVVCDRGNERSRMQIFTKNGHFLKKIAVRYIDIVAGLAVTQQGHIVAVDSVTPTVFVISENGDLLSWFDCSECMREPSDIAINGKEFYVCDFKGHCVVVFSEDGKFLRRIGQENVTNFPNGIDVSDAGDVLIGDSHGNKFHVAVFTREGTLLTEFECPYVKVSRCCGLKITSEGYIVTLAKNNHHVLVLNTLYIV